MAYTYFHEDFIDSIKQIEELNCNLKRICCHLCTISPKNNKWYFTNYVFQVDVPFEDYDIYESFLKDLVEDNYSYIEGYTKNCRTYMVSLFSLQDIIMEEKNYILRRGNYGLL